MMRRIERLGKILRFGICNGRKILYSKKANASGNFRCWVDLGPAEARGATMRWIEWRGETLMIPWWLFREWVEE